MAKNQCVRYVLRPRAVLPAAAIMGCFLFYMLDRRATDSRLAAAQAELQTAIEGKWGGAPAQYSDQGGRDLPPEYKDLPDGWTVEWIPKMPPPIGPDGKGSDPPTILVTEDENGVHSQLLNQNAPNYDPAGGLPAMELQKLEEKWQMQEKRAKAAEMRKRLQCTTYNGQDMKGHDIADGVVMDGNGDGSLEELCCQKCMDDDDCAAATLVGQQCYMKGPRSADGAAVGWEKKDCPHCKLIVLGLRANWSTS